MSTIHRHCDSYRRPTSAPSANRDCSNAEFPAIDDRRRANRRHRRVESRPISEVGDGQNAKKAACRFRLYQMLANAICQKVAPGRMGPRTRIWGRTIRYTAPRHGSYPTGPAVRRGVAPACWIDKYDFQKSSPSSWGKLLNCSSQWVMVMSTRAETIQTRSSGK